MEREMYQHLNESFNQSNTHVRLTEFPIYGEFVNPGTKKKIIKKCWLCKVLPELIFFFNFVKIFN